MKYAAIFVLLAGVSSGCERSSPAPAQEPSVTSSEAQPRAVVGEAAPVVQADELATPPPAAVAVEALEKVPGLSGIAWRGCVAHASGFARCSFTGDGGFEGRVEYKLFDTAASAQFECESLAGAASSTLLLGAGYSRWQGADSVLVATESLCFCVQVRANGAYDAADTLRVATELADNAASLARDEAPQPE
jgi:hypothetical protein